MFIDTVAKFRPKTVIMENVEGLLCGNAYKYVEKIYAKVREIGYTVRHWLLNGENMGVPQTRHRVFFVATRLDYDLSNIDLTFNYEPITYGDIMTGQHAVNNGKVAEVAKLSSVEDKNLSDTMMRLYNKYTYFTKRIVYRNKVCPTIVAGSSDIWIENWGAKINQNEIINAQTFPKE